MDRNHNRQRLIDSARELIHQRGYRQTTLADIARAADFPLGNVYYYFRSKAAIGEAVIDQRLRIIEALIREWEHLPHPRQRLSACLDMVQNMRDTLAEHGCPVGGLAHTIAKDEPRLADPVHRLLKTMTAWAIRQYAAAGHPRPQSAGLAFIGALQGIAVLAHALGTPALVVEQIDRLRSMLPGSPEATDAQHQLAD